jgi:hypothetical protein
MNRLAGSSYHHKPRGSWKIKKIANSAGAPPAIGDQDVFVTFEVTEPLLLSPFIFGHLQGKQGFYGIQTMQFQFNIAPNANRAWRSASLAADNKTASVVSFTNSQLLFQFMTPHPSDRLEPRNVVPFYEMPLMRTVNNPDLPAIPRNGQIDTTGTFGEAAPVTLQSSNMQLSGIPISSLCSSEKFHVI